MDVETGPVLPVPPQSENERLEALVRERTAQLVALTQHLQTVREDERHRLARDLHDELGALLTSAKLDAARIRSRLLQALPTGNAEALERLAHLSSTLDQVIALKRRIAEDLRPSALAHLGLPAALGILAREVERSADLRLHCDFHAVRLTPAAELTVYRLVQESVNNVAKHAQASNVWLSLAPQPDATRQVELVIRDDGAGFDPARVRHGAHGLVGMRYRVQAEHGTMVVDSAPGRGATVRVLLPMAAQPDALV